MIRQAADQDLPAITKIEAELFPEDNWSEEMFAGELHNNPFSSIYVYEEENIIGYIILWIMYEQAEIADFGVSVSMQHKHIGTQLLDKCIRKAVSEGCENISLEVRVSNTNAISLYEKAGFQNINIRKGYYEDGEDAYLMLKPLGGLHYDDAAGN